MQKRTALNIATLLVAGIFILNLLAIRLNLYWTLPWFDVLMHFLGGVFLGIMLYVLFYNHLNSLRHSRVAFFFVLLGGTLLVGFLWEVFEFVLRNYLNGTLEQNVPDTLADVFFDMLGGTVSALFVYKQLPSNGK